MNKVHLFKNHLPVYLLPAPLSCVLFVLYIRYDVWMFFTCLLVYIIQLSILPRLSDGKSTHEVTIKDKFDLLQLDSQYKIIRGVSIGIIVLTVILDTFPFWAASERFHIWCGFYFPLYEGGLIVSVMTILTILLLLISFNEIIRIDSPSAQYNANVKEQNFLERQRKRKEADAIIHHEQNIAKYGEGFIEICPQFIVNERTGKLWLGMSEFSFDDIIDAKIKDDVTQRTTGGSITTKTNTGDMVGRAVVGGIISGGIGSVIGGATARKDSTVSPMEISTVHRYTVLVTTKRISNPLVTIPCEQDTELAHRCVATLNAVIHSAK